MSRVQTYDPKTIVNPETKSMFDQVSKKFGRVPNIFRNMANSPAVLKGFLSLEEAGAQTSFSPDFREQIAIAVSQANQCYYCLAAHSALLQSLPKTSSDPKKEAILSFVDVLVKRKGHVSDIEVESLKNTGVSDQELTEIVLLVAISLFSNYFNLVTDPAVDFPEVQLAGAK
jgi:AhpD family alkylhydroperoxidase